MAPDDEIVSKGQRLKMLRQAVKVASRRGSIQGWVLKELESIARTGEHLDGTKAARGVRAYALKLLHSEVPEKVLEKAVGVAAQEATSIRIAVVLDSPALDSRVTPEMVRGMFTTGEEGEVRQITVSQDTHTDNEEDDIDSGEEE